MLNYQTVISGKDLLTNEPAPYGYEPIVDGFRIKLDGTFDAPTAIASVSLNDTKLYLSGVRWVNENYIFTDFTYFGYTDGTVAASLGPAGYVDGAGGTTDVELLQEDYEIRWTGVLGNEVINGLNLEVTTSGGSFVTIVGASGYSIADHPLNPNPGVAEPFAIKVPFEVWNIDENQQVNVLMWDRTGNPTVEGGKIWNTDNRVYVWVVNTDYSPDVLDPLSDAVTNYGTWNWVMYQSTFTTGDVIKISYANPILLTDKLTFTTDYLSDVSNSDILPNKYELYQNYPNPFNPSTKIGYSIQKEGLVNITIYNILGQKVREVVNQFVKPGKYEATFNGANLASGVYIYRIKTNDFVKSKKMMLLK
ncbi:MAG: T9SS type A sorting domain-containing protein [Ignavibacteriales bacterium]|nr:T9SS type A sorting domain-containing protein [Ignavibacteriales bacterium]